MLTENVEICCQLSGILQTTLGPCGMDKLIMDETNGLMTTNDGATLIKHLHLNHPAAILLSQVSQSQDQLVGDGTTSIVLLSAELLKQANVLVTSKNIHPSHIIQVYRKAQRFTCDLIDKLALSLTPENTKSYLQMIATTTIGSKIIGINNVHFRDMAVEASLRLENFDKNVFVFKRTGASIAHSRLLDGIMLKCRRLGVSSPTSVKNAKILLCKISNLSSSRSKIHNVKIDLDGGEADILSKIETDQLEQICDQVFSTGANVVFNCGAAIHYHAEQYLNNKGVLCMGYVDNSDCEMIATATGAKIVSRIDSDSSSRLGKAKMVKQILLADELALEISGCDNLQGWCSVLFRAPTRSMLNECEISFNDALCALSEALKSKKVIGGGGCLYMHVAEKMRQGARINGGVQQLVIESFASSLEIIPTILCSNGGFNASSIISQLSKLHSSPESSPWMGVDMIEGKVFDTVNAGILESSSILNNIIKGSVDASEMILRIDQNILLKPDKSLEQLGYM
ncbi:thermosome subunit alpha [Acrasis kona]|uniref:Thermosome subunit alpha n=1 Tax=Acrasis kona TaxID=1008807 RepID=A0AAW2Z9W8_9EUKA